MDYSSLAARIVLRSLGGSHPIRIAIGVSVSLILYCAINIITRQFSPTATRAFIESIPAFWYPIVITPLFFVPVVFVRSRAPESVWHDINAINAILNESNLPKQQRQRIWRNVLDRYVRSINPEGTLTTPILDVAQADLTSIR